MEHNVARMTYDWGTTEQAPLASHSFTDQIRSSDVVVELEERIYRLQAEISSMRYRLDMMESGKGVLPKLIERLQHESRANNVDFYEGLQRLLFED